MKLLGLALCGCILGHVASQDQYLAHLVNTDYDDQLQHRNHPHYPDYLDEVQHLKSPNILHQPTNLDPLKPDFEDQLQQISYRNQPRYPDFLDEIHHQKSLNTPYQPTNLDPLKTDFDDQLQQISYRNQPRYPDYLDEIHHLKSLNPPYQPNNLDPLKTDFDDQLQQINYRNQLHYPDYLDEIEHLKSPNLHYKPTELDLLKTNYYGHFKHPNYPNQFQLYRYSNPDQQHEKVRNSGKFQSHNNSEEYQWLNYNGKAIHPNQLPQFYFHNQDEQFNQYAGFENRGNFGEPQLRSYDQLLNNHGPFNSLKSSNRLSNYLSQDRQSYQQNKFEKFRNASQPQRRNFSGENQQLNNHSISNYRRQSQHFNYPGQTEQLNPQAKFENYRNFDESQLSNFAEDLLMNYRSPFNYPSYFQHPSYPSQDRQIYNRNKLQQLSNLYQPYLPNFARTKRQFHYRNMPNYPSQFQQLNNLTQDEQLNPQDKFEEGRNFEKSQLRNFVEEDQLMNYHSSFKYPNHFQQPSYFSHNQNKLQKFKNLYQPHLPNFAREKFHYRSVPNYFRHFQPFMYPTQAEQLNPVDKFEEDKNVNKSQLRNFVEKDHMLKYGSPFNYPSQLQQEMFLGPERHPRPYLHNFYEKNQVNYRNMPTYPRRFQQFSQDKLMNPSRFDKYRNFEHPHRRPYVDDFRGSSYYPDKFRHHDYFRPDPEYHQQDGTKQFQNPVQPQLSDSSDVHQQVNYNDTSDTDTFDGDSENIVSHLESLEDVHPEKKDQVQADNFLQSNQSDGHSNHPDQLQQFNQSNHHQEQNQSQHSEHSKYQDEAPSPAKFQEDHKLNYTALVYEICHLETIHGPCKAGFQRYFYNAATGNCEKFVYGGCYGNANNFFTMEECENMCKGQ